MSLSDEEFFSRQDAVNRISGALSEFSNKSFNLHHLQEKADLIGEDLQRKILAEMIEEQVLKRDGAGAGEYSKWRYDERRLDSYRQGLGIDLPPAPADQARWSADQQRHMVPAEGNAGAEARGEPLSYAERSPDSALLHALEESALQNALQESVLDHALHESARQYAVESADRDLARALELSAREAVRHESAPNEPASTQAGGVPMPPASLTQAARMQSVVHGTSAASRDTGLRRSPVLGMATGTPAKRAPRVP
ncbi:hypothetical protein OG568_60690 (plasmid) [Streptomyces sp. NBC_01450]|uniref:hypothetical protein n=1 Tax=Streptomyces sp. NBC_01450 TaxID=2903871 RepID=UPI002E300A0E|nr:hypothetical protein [Streptomyces sp. NBC_01450]